MLLAASRDLLKQVQPFEISGTIAAVRGLTVLADDLPVPIGAIVRLETTPHLTTEGRTMRFEMSSGARSVSSAAPRGEVIGFDGGRSIIMLLNHAASIAPGMRVTAEQTSPMIGVGDSLLGRVIDGFGRAIDHAAQPGGLTPRALYPNPPRALNRSRIREPLPTGVRAIDGFLTIGRGQRIGVFSAAGAGKSTLIGMMARRSAAEVNVIALVGERGREVREVLEESLGVEGLRRSVVVVATGDESPLLRVRAALVACAVAEHFRDQGRHVLLMMDSITRLAHAQRQIGLAVGEQPATRGYTPSVFAMLPLLLERAGTVEGAGSITGVYSVLVEGDDLDEPVSDAVRGVLDGHIILSRKLTSRGQYPAIDVLRSISRLASEVCDPHHIAARRHLLRLLSAYEQSEELINIGAYSRGANPDCDVAIALRPKLLEFLEQDVDDEAAYAQTCRSMIELSGAAERLAVRPTTQPATAAARKV